MHYRAANCKTIPATATGSQRLARSLSILDGAVCKKARRKSGAAIKSWQWAFLHSEPFTADTPILSLYFSLSLLAVSICLTFLFQSIKVKAFAEQLQQRYNNPNHQTN